MWDLFQISRFLQVPYMIIITVVSAITLADEDMWGGRLKRSQHLAYIVKGLKDVDSALYWTVMNVLKHFATLWAMFILDMHSMCIIK